jgi:hypothetical protein
LTTVRMDSRFKKNGHIIYKDLEDGPALFDPYRRTMIRLNPVSREIWKLLDGQLPVEGIVESIANEFEAPRGDISRDVSGFLKELLKREIIT